MPQERTRKIVIIGAMGAISILLGITHWGFIPWITGTALTIMTVPVIIGAVLEGPIVGFAIGLIFGVFSMIQAAVAPTGPGDVIFTNPVISVIPRLFIGPVSYYVWKILQGKPIVGLIAAGIAGSLTNTILVLGAIVLLGFAPLAAALTVFVGNGLAEAAISALITVVVVAAWKRLRIGKREGAQI